MKTVTYDETQWKLVPIEPTETMLSAGVPKNAVLDEGTAFMFRKGRISTWRHMLEATPTPPVDAGSAQDREDAERYRFLKDNIQEGYELPGAYYIDDGDTSSWDKTIDAARAAKEQP